MTQAIKKKKTIFTCQQFWINLPVGTVGRSHDWNNRFEKGKLGFLMSAPQTENLKEVSIRYTRRRHVVN